MRKIYPRATFIELYQAIAQKLLENNPPIRILNSKGRQDTNELGVKWTGPGREKSLNNAAAVIHARLCELNFINEVEDANLNYGKQLYDKFNALQRDPKLTQVVIQGKTYNEGLLRFLGFDSFEAFQNSLQSQTTNNSGNPKEGPKDALEEHTPFTFYLGTYYSFRSYRINKYILAIRYTDTPTQPMECWQWGFHTSERLVMPDQLPDKVNSVLFKGTAVVRGRHLYINLDAPASDNGYAMEMHLVGICDETGGYQLKYQEAIPCSLQTISLDQYTISLETYLLRCSEEIAKSIMNSPEAYFNHELPAEPLTTEPSRVKALQLYLMLQRRNFRIKFRPNVSNLDNLEYRSNHVNNYTERLSGEYRIWNFGLRRGVVVQSKLVVSTEVPYRTYFYPYLNDELKRNNPGLEEQLAVLMISNEIRHDQLCFATFVKRKLTLVNYAIFDIRNLRDDNWVEGMFITTGYDKKGIIGGYAVMCKIKPGENCDPKHMALEEAEAYARSLGLTEMHDGLRKLWKRKLWKQKSNTQFSCHAVLIYPNKGMLMVRQENGPYTGKFDLPGGKLLHGETPEVGLRRLVKEATGVSIGTCALWNNESISVTWKRPDKVEENLHLLGALYCAHTEDSQIGELNRQAIWIKKGQYNADSFSPFALKAMEELMD